MQQAEYALMDAAEANMWWYRALHERLIDALNGLMGAAEAGTTRPDPVRRLLDAGCGTGGFLTMLRLHRPDLDCTGLEWDPAAVRRARLKSATAMVRGSLNTLPFADASFDIAVSADVLCHAAVDPAPALQELKRILRPGGCLVLNLPAYRWLLSAHDRRVRNIRRMTASGTADMLRRAGFIRIRTRYWNGLLLPLMVVQRKLLARGEAASDVVALPAWLNTMLRCVTEIERRLPFPLPAGGSVLATAEKP